MKHTLPILLAMSFFSFSAAADAPAVPSLQTDAFSTPDGKTVTFTCIKHASVRIRYDGLEIQIDPVGQGLPPATDYARFPKADLILVTHEHFDHFDRDAIAALQKDSTAIFANPAVHGMLGWGEALANGGKIQWRDDISIEAVPAYNTTPGREKFHPKGRDNGYILSLGGFRVYVAGDTEDIPEMAAIKDIDVAFLPCNQPYTMTPEQAASAAETIRPKVLFPYHYGETPIQKLADLLAGSGIDVRIRNYQ
jgi:L-ascorbate metabolism protein UlaG (beta-lactamase superfamily)